MAPNTDNIPCISVLLTNPLIEMLVLFDVAFKA